MVFKWVKKISAADLVTLSNGMLGFLAITFILDGSEYDILIARILLLVAIMLDGLDGAVARYFGSKHEFGRHLDSIADTMSFCLAPAMFVYALYYNPNYSSLENVWNLSVLITSGIVFIAGIIRLARFVESGHELRYFSGCPTPATAFVLITMSFFLPPVWIFIPAVLFISFLMLSEVKYPKIRGATAFAMVPAGLVAAIVPYLEYAGHVTATAANILLLIPVLTILGYLGGGPFHVKKRSRE